MRAAPNLRGKTMGHLDSGDRVEILERSAENMRIANMNAFWYRMRRLSDDVTGWSYGYFMKFER